jgi:GntR family carbon starvation induced transcriptional regulator
MSYIEKKDKDTHSLLRSAIIQGAFAPGERLKFASLSVRFGSSYGSLREALSLLVSEGFVTQEINKGFTVAPVSLSELYEITEHYIELEKRAITKSIEKGDDIWEAEIVAANHRLNLIERLSWEERVSVHAEWVARHREFHEKLVDPCRGSWLFRLRSIMFDQLDRYRFVTKMSYSKGAKSRGSEHAEIMEAVVSRNADFACKLIERHVERTVDRAVKILK